MNSTIRPAQTTDRAALIEVEAGATPNLSYVGNVFDMFLADKEGEFCVAEVDGRVVACGKFTVVPDGSAWLETIRVLPAYQGQGIGKRFYKRFFEIARAQHVSTMRMYTGTKNVVSKGLAEHFGFRTVETFRGAWRPIDAPSDEPADEPLPQFQQITDPAQAADLLLAQAADWNHFLVMNRTFYKLTPALCAALAESGQVYADPDSGSVIAVGARFMPQSAYHIGHFAGDPQSCIDIATQLGLAAGSVRLSCLFPAAKGSIQQTLLDHGFQLEPAEFIVMERNLAEK